MKPTRIALIATCFALGLPMAAQAEVGAEQKAEALATYATIAQHSYADALADAKALHAALEALAKAPGAETLEAAKQAWLAARESYGPTEVFRLSGGPIDAETGWIAQTYGAPEGQINAWPLDENMIDYTTDADGNRTAGNIIDTAGVFTPGGEDVTEVDVTTITPETIAALNENGGEANVASGYHAIEFLLWGQDQDYANMIEDSVTPGPLSAGARPVSDFTSDPHAARRLAYLQAAGAQLVADLSTVAAAWDETVAGDSGLYRAALLGELTGDQAAMNIPTQEAIKQILTGVGVFAKSELANERIAVAVLTPSEEDEHSCFSDNTHRDIALNYEGIHNVLLGEYQGQDVGMGFADVLSSEERANLDALMERIAVRIAVVNETAETTMHFDYQIHPENEDSVQNIVTLKNELRRLGDQMVMIAPEYGLSLTTDNVTDPEETQIN
ncbi:imelysin [Rhodobacter sp. TJ_12]|uniref:imelysin family protein n=1 Tax=Rhodobacter sp. TJ_12 TaxID=2029399 RepID=UPI001CBD7674|nr:imelysin family protein [Rhodobacter sp. TJ_12]MBZ4023752.1 imelysin [Rhodobacter sp. TJ_12]